MFPEKQPETFPSSSIISTLEVGIRKWDSNSDDDERWELGDGLTSDDGDPRFYIQQSLPVDQTQRAQDEEGTGTILRSVQVRDVKEKRGTKNRVRVGRGKAKCDLENTDCGIGESRIGGHPERAGTFSLLKARKEEEQADQCETRGRGDDRGNSIRSAESLRSAKRTTPTSEGEDEEGAVSSEHNISIGGRERTLVSTNGESKEAVNADDTNPFQ
ncbi:unnamed protein product [Calypogeia fissa]